MSAPLNRTEQFVSQVCEKSFLTFWCYANPQAPNGKELCDVLVVCHPHIIVVSVKEIALNLEKDPEVAFKRWERKAVDASVSQLYGAERALAGMTQVIRRDGTPGLDLPSPDELRIHRIAVAFGDRNEAVTKSQDYGKGYVHVMGEQSFTDVLTELDTVTDFTDYLLAKEKLKIVLLAGSEGNMLAHYLSNDRAFPQNADVSLFNNDLWRGLQGNESYRRRKQAEEASYAWDWIINAMADTRLVPVEGPPPTLPELDLALRAMASERRFHRRILGEHLVGFIHEAVAGKLRSRLLASPSGVTYVFVFFDNRDTPEQRRAEMLGRSYLARKHAGKGEIVVGIGLSPHVPGKGTMSDLTYVRFPQWTAVEVERADAYERITKHFTAQGPVRVHTDEYPR